ncbi:MAG: ATP-dependent DNA helicase RecQ [Bacteroidota bacterium]
MDQAHAILKQYWGYHKFRLLQKDIIDAVIRHEDVLALLPTGGGKSICFQVPALAMEGLCIVVTPLIALMKDQVANLNNKGIKAEALFSGMRKREIDIVLDNCVYGGIKFLYVSPERLETDIFKARVTKMHVSLIAVDEAHCISHWGYDFRPSYLRIADIRNLLAGTSLIALTATATPEVVDDIQKNLGFVKSNVFQRSFSRSNLSYSVREVEDIHGKLIEVVKGVAGSAIVYVRTRKEAKDIAVSLDKNGISASFYHAGLDHSQRDIRQKKWQNNKVRIMVATNAFGMGIDKPNVRLVVHLGLNQDIESYFQEAGRAGRDEKKAYAVVIFNESHVDDLKQRVKLQHPGINYLKQVYQALANYYKLATGSGMGQSFDFDIRQFSERFELNHLEVFYALKKLEEEGLIGFNESYYNPSHLHIAVDNTELYKFQVANAGYDHIIKGLLRLYGGEVFNHFLTISEVQLAKFMEVDVIQVKVLLSKLHDLNIVDYEPQRDKPQIIFMKPRERVGQLSLDKVRLKRREELAAQKSDAVINYVKHKELCRSRLLLQYFGEEMTTECGVCDICIKRKKKNQTEHFHKYRHQINNILGSQPLTVEEVMDQINPSARDTFLEVIRDMVDSHELKYDKKWKLSKM